MKRKAKLLLTVLAVCAMSAFGILASGCNAVDKVKEKINQARCKHEWNEGEITKEATCIEVGEKTKTCSKCGKIETEEIETIAHVEVYVPAVEATCMETGLTDGVKCAVCDEIIVKQMIIPVKGHHVVTDAAVTETCLTVGKKQGLHCDICNEVLEAQKTIPATGHSLVEVKGYAATCTEAGLTDGIKCSLCDTVFTEQEVIEKSEHVGNVGDNCSLCGNVIEFDENEITLVEASVGEKVAGNWYRIYCDKNMTFSGMNFPTPSWQNIIGGGVGLYGASVGIYYLSGSTNLFNGGGYGPANCPELLTIVHEGYIDVYMEVGTYECVATSGSSGDCVYRLVVDEDLEIASLTGRVYRIEV